MAILGQCLIRDPESLQQMTGRLSLYLQTTHRALFDDETLFTTMFANNREKHFIFIRSCEFRKNSNTL